MIRGPPNRGSLARPAPLFGAGTELGDDAQQQTSVVFRSRIMLISMRERIQKALADHGRMSVDPNGVDADADLYELGLTSHASVNVMLALEDDFDIEFPDEAMKKSTFASINNIEAAVTSLIK